MADFMPVIGALLIESAFAPQDYPDGSQYLVQQERACGPRA
jgi:hypothetical protein